jgi:hypothetical protein
MRSLIPIGLLLAALAARGEIVDRIAVAAGTQVITERELEREIRLTAFLNRETPDFGPAAKRAACERLIEQKLIRRELEMSRYPAAEPGAAEPLWEGIRKSRGLDTAGFAVDLAKAGLAEADLRQHLRWQITLLRFIEVRFRPAGGDPGDAGAGQKVDAEMNRWLKEARGRTRVQYFEEVLR